MEYDVTISLTITGANLGTMATTVEMPQADGDRFFAYIMAAYGADSEGNARTPSQAVDAFVAQTWQEQSYKALRWEQERVANAAAEAVAPLDFRFAG